MAPPVPGDRGRRDVSVVGEGTGGGPSGGGPSDQTDRFLRADAEMAEPVPQGRGVPRLYEGEDPGADVRGALPGDEEGGTVQPVESGDRTRRVHRGAADHRRDVVGQQFTAGPG